MCAVQNTTALNYETCYLALEKFITFYEIRRFDQFAMAITGKLTVDSYPLQLQSTSEDFLSVDTGMEDSR